MNKSSLCKKNEKQTKFATIYIAKICKYKMYIFEENACTCLWNQNDLYHISSIIAYESCSKKINFKYI